MQTILEQQGTILAALMPLLPLLQAVPLHIESACNNVKDALRDTYSANRAVEEKTRIMTDGKTAGTPSNVMNSYTPAQCPSNGENSSSKSCSLSANKRRRLSSSASAFQNDREPSLASSTPAPVCPASTSPTAILSSPLMMKGGTNRTNRTPALRQPLADVTPLASGTMRNSVCPTLNQRSSDLRRSFSRTTKDFNPSIRIQESQARRRRTTNRINFMAGAISNNDLSTAEARFTDSPALSSAVFDGSTIDDTANNAPFLMPTPLDRRQRKPSDNVKSSAINAKVRLVGPGVPSWSSPISLRLDTASLAHAQTPTVEVQTRTSTARQIHSSCIASTAAHSAEDTPASCQPEENAPRLPLSGSRLPAKSNQAAHDIAPGLRQSSTKPPSLRERVGAATVSAGSLCFYQGLTSLKRFQGKRFIDLGNDDDDLSDADAEGEDDLEFAFL